MNRYIAGTDRGQETVLPTSLEETIEVTNPVRVIDAFVDSLSLSEIGVCRIQPAKTGRPPYDARDLLKLYLYGYMNRIRSSRRLQKECHRNIEVFFLLNHLRERAAKYKGYQKRMAETGETQILETDPECRTLHSKDGLHPAYNVQTVVDEKHHLIADFMATNANTDQGMLLPMVRQLKETLGMETVHFVADKGYEGREDIENCIQNGVIPDVGFKYDKEARYHVLDHEPVEITPEEKASTEPANIQKCLKAGILPDCYEGSNISVEVQHLDVESCFIRHADGRVTCPMGRELFKLRERKNGTIYGSAEACRTCPHRCTQSKGKKTVSFGPNTVYVPVLMYGVAEYPVQQIPDVEQNTPYHAYRRRKWRAARVMIRIRRDLALQQKRKEKVTAEMALSFTAYNLRRAINTVGVPDILVHFYKKK